VRHGPTAAALALLLVACSEPTFEPQGIGRTQVRGGGRRAPAAAAPREAEEANRPTLPSQRRPTRRGRPDRPPPSFEGTGATPPETAEGLGPEAEPERDTVPQDLARAYDASPCFRADPEQDEVRIGVTVTLSATGRVNRAEVRAPVDAETLACLEARALALRADTDRVRTVRFDVRYAVSRQAPEDPEPGPDWTQVPRAQGAASPERTLEMAGTVEDRPRGFVNPGRTLPALAPRAGPAPGSVAPGIVLPAQGEPLPR
jgi:hypothetical protein